MNCIQAYMVELYQDTLIDLLLPKHAKHLKLDIKKDSKVNCSSWLLLAFSFLVRYDLVSYEFPFLLVLLSNRAWSL